MGGVRRFIRPYASGFALDVGSWERLVVNVRWNHAVLPVRMPRWPLLAASMPSVEPSSRYRLIAIGVATVFVVAAVVLIRAARLPPMRGHGPAIERVKGVVARVTGANLVTLTPQTRLRDLTSGGVSERDVIAALDDEFRTEISDDDAERLITLKDAADLLERKSAPTPP
jgi:acyl carrier protein